MWRTPPDTEPKPSASGALVAIASVAALGLLAFGINELYVSHLAPSALEREWLKSQRAGGQETLPTLSDADFVTMSRSQCYGSCPAYAVTIRASGQIEFAGEAFVCRRHVAASALDVAALSRLFQGLEAVKFAALPNYQRQDVSDQVTVTITVARGGASHSVSHYYGDSQAPRVLTAIEDRIDKLAGTAAWTGTPADGTVNCTLPDGRRTPVAREIPGDGAP